MDPRSGAVTRYAMATELNAPSSRRRRIGVVALVASLFAGCRYGYELLPLEISGDLSPNAGTAGVPAQLGGSGTGFGSGGASSASATGGATAQGGISTGGAVGAGAMSAGGMASGGSASGGAGVGGAPMGSAGGMGGSSTAGSASVATTGGTAGSASGGAATGGTATGGTATGGTGAGPAMLVGYWKLDEADTNGLAMDSSGFGNHGTYSTAKPSVNVGVPPEIQFANPMCLRFNGTSNYVTIPYAASYFGTASESYSVSAWSFLAVVPSDWMALVGHEDLIRTCGLFINPFGDWQFGDSFAPVTTGSWHHIAAVQDATQNLSLLYIDGVLIPGAAPAANCPTMQSVFIGSGDGTDDHWNGRIDDVRLYSGALTPAEIAALYAGNN